MATAGKELPGVLDFQLVKASRSSASLFAEISRFLDTQDTSHPFQLPLWCNPEARLAVLRNRSVAWVAQAGVLYPAGRILPFIRAFTVNHGPVCDDLAMWETGLHELVDEGRRRGFAYIDISPDWTGPSAEDAASVLSRNGWQALEGDRLSLRLDLKPGLEEVFANFRATTRHEIRRSEAAGIDVTVAREERELRDFLRLYFGLARERKFSANEPDLLLHIFSGLVAEPSRGGLFLAREGGALKGGILVVRCGARCWYTLGATAKDGKVTAGHLLQWRAIQWAKESGCREYDFCGYREGMNTGPSVFKRGFCSRVVRFAPTYRYIVDQNRRTLVDVISSLRSRIPRFQEPARTR
jgi:peptidoglycan pentaglycine glycine transferase (the first glycine)